jgi:hypothetical protein
MSGSPKLSVELNLFTLGLLISIQLRLLCWHVCGCLSYRSRTVRFLMDECFVSSGDPRQFEESRTECQKAVPCKFLTWSVFLITVAQFNFSWIKANDFFQNIIILFGIYRNNTMSNVQHTKIPMTYLERRTIDFPCFEYTKISIFVNWVHKYKIWKKPIVEYWLFENTVFRHWRHKNSIFEQPIFNNSFFCIFYIFVYSMHENWYFHVFKEQKNYWHVFKVQHKNFHMLNVRNDIISVISWIQIIFLWMWKK